MLPKAKPCRFCGEPFVPDSRVGDRQYACSKPTCKAQRKRASQERWVATHPDYFRGLYQKKRPWHQAHPGYLAEYRRSHPEAAQHHRDQERQRRHAPSAVDIQDESREESRTQGPMSQAVPCDSSCVDIQDEIPQQTAILYGLIERLRSGKGVDIQDQFDEVVSDCYKLGRDLQFRRALP